MPDPNVSLAATPRWKGDAGRMEVWYATITDPATGTGLWIHYETIAPTPERGGEPYGHGWISVFPVDGPPVTARFGPAPIEPWTHGEPWFTIPDAAAEDGRWSGTAGPVTWDLRWSDGGAPLWTFHKVAWDKELLPGAQNLLAPTATWSGSVKVGDTTYGFDGGRGGVAHIYSHGNTKRWGWLHADLGGDDVLELITTTSMSPGLNKLPPLAFLKLRVDGADWPTSALPAVRAKTTLGVERWKVEGRIGSRRIRVVVDQPADRCVALEYIDPDGERAVCTNTERADVAITVERRDQKRWVNERSWTLQGTGHAEVGLRAPSAPPLNERIVT